MPTYVAVPKLGMAMVEATVVNWEVEEGAEVSAGQIVLTIETDKTNWEIESSAPGFLHVLVEEDEIVPVGRVVGLLAADQSELEALQSKPLEVIMTTVPEPEDDSMAGIPATEAAAPPPPPPPASAPAATTRRGKIRISPAARKVAEENGLDPSTVRGTGPDGRIVRADVERAITESGPYAGGPEPVVPAPPGPPPVTSPGNVAAGTGKRVAATIPLKGMRRAIADHMQTSLAGSAQLTYMGEAEMTEVVALRKRLLSRETELGFHVTYTDIIVLAIARALKDVLIVNSSIVGDEICVWEDINIGVAVSLDAGLEGGLIVPVVRGVDGKSLREVSLELGSLVERARAGKLLPDDVAEGTFTVTNLATVGGGWFTGTPIINQPQSAIIAIGSVSERPAVRDGGSWSGP